MHRKWVKSHYTSEPHNKGLHKLSGLRKNVSCKFMAANCDNRLAHRLLEMGFVPGEDVTVVTNSGKKGSIMVKVKGSKVALSNKIADNILVRKIGKNHGKSK